MAVYVIGNPRNGSSWMFKCLFLRNFSWVAQIALPNCNEKADVHILFLEVRLVIPHNDFQENAASIPSFILGYFNQATAPLAEKQNSVLDILNSLVKFIYSFLFRYKYFNHFDQITSTSEYFTNHALW